MNDLYNILMSDDVVGSINNNFDYLIFLIPEIKYMIGFEHRHPHHHLDVWNHTLLALSLSECNFEIRLSLLLHDIGKPFSYQKDGNIRHFKNHAEVSAKIAQDILKRLNFEKNFINDICELIRLHDTPITDDDIKNNIMQTKILYQIQTCDALAHNPKKLEKRKEYLKEIGNKINKDN